MTSTADTAEATFEAAWDQWHSERERSYADPLGWVSLTGLYWLTDEFETVADLPGRWRADADAVYVPGIAVSRSFVAPARPHCAYTTPSLRTFRRTTAFPPTRRANSGESPAPSPR